MKKLVFREQTMKKCFENYVFCFRNGTPNARNGCPEPPQIRSTSAAGRDYAEIMQNGPLFSFGSEGSENF